MKYGLTIPAFAEYSDPLYLAQIAQQAEAAGWDGFFIWDQLIFDHAFHAMGDPYIGLAAVALSTRTIRLGALVTPLPRRRPWIVARQAVSLDILSGGRLIFGVGLGGPVEGDFSYFSEQQDNRVRAAKLDEGLEILVGLWSGTPFAYMGQHYTLSEVVFQPTPVQKPRIPIWIGGGWDRIGVRKRAARWDGFFPAKREMVTVEEWQTIQASVRGYRSRPEPCLWIHAGKSPGDDLDRAARLVQPYADIGIDWWIEEINPWRYGHGWFAPWTSAVVDLMNTRIMQGPPHHRKE